jgi:3-methyladenine DNA glycosylase AlkC
VHAALPDFDPQAFAADVMTDLPNLELKARIARTARGLHDHLPVVGRAALDALVRSLPPSPEAAGVTGDFGLHVYSPHSEYVAQYHRTTEDLDQALTALRTFTRYFSAEDGVRRFLNDFPEQTLVAVHRWAGDDDYRVRRLASESTRPLLPWSPRITLPPDAALPVLHQLHADTSRFVTTSVANHLRDITATDPEMVLTMLTQWKTERRVSGKELDFIAREALKTLLKKGWAPAYEFLGFPTGTPIELSSIRLERTELNPGDELAFTADLSTRTSTPLHVAYVISSTTQHGARREKVYFLRRAVADPDQPLTVARTHVLRVTGTAAVHPGPHQLELQVNGRRFAPAEFRVLGPAGATSPG